MRGRTLSPFYSCGKQTVQTYANFALLGALTAYCFTDTGGKLTAKAAKYLAIACLAVFAVTEGLALLA